MFGKIKGKLKGVFSKSADEVFDDEVLEEPVEDVIESEKESSEVVKENEKVKKKGFLDRMFGRKEEEQVDVEEVQDEVLEGVSEEEKEEIKSGRDVDEKIIEEQKKKLEKTIAREEVVEKEEVLEIKKVNNEEPKVDKAVGQDVSDVEEGDEEDSEMIAEKKKGFFSKTFQKFTQKKLSESDFNKIWSELEIFLLEINIAYDIVLKIESGLKESLVDVSFDRFSLAKKIREVLVKEVSSLLAEREDDLVGKIKEFRRRGEIAKILVLGVNGTGKTTSIAKLVHFLKKNDLSVVVAAADTFRAAAVEQLDEHAQRVGFRLIKHKGGSDPAAVAFDAIEHAKAKNVDVVLIDTAGRMPNNSNLMNELAKIERVSQAQINLFIGDSVSGNDLLEQIELFDKVVGITGLILTKTDTDERPGSIVTAAYSIEKPIYYLGTGQGYDDFVKFDGQLVAEKLFEMNE